MLSIEDGELDAEFEKLFMDDAYADSEKLDILYCLVSLMHSNNSEIEKKLRNLERSLYKTRAIADNIEGNEHSKKVLDKDAELVLRRCSRLSSD